VAACPEAIIAIDAGGFPEVNFQRGGCTFCGDCVTACPTGALADLGQPAWSGAARIAASCLSFQGTSCRLCEEHCEPRAIRFRPLPGGRALPEVDVADCTACGACLHICPVDAVTIQEVAP
jgi:ferredoxin-type protein NapF